MTQVSRRTFLKSACLTACALQSQRLRAFDSSAAALVHAPSGTLRGDIADGVRIFRGVPFAESPIGPLRFRFPVKIKPWTGERDATKFSAAPLQPIHGPEEVNVPHSEDCLYLNIWAPEGPGPFPVFVWIHGGGFTAGHASEPMYDGTEFAKQGIISVSIAYRLGVFGFLDFEPLLGADYAGTANNGLSDLITGLEWIHENIAAFGGDPARVTIGGESAGAKLTDILMGVPSAQPLFHQMISESGGAERLWTGTNSIAIAKGFGAEWSQRAGSSVAGLRNAAGAGLIEAQTELLKTWPQHFPLRAEVDGKLLPRLPVQTIAAGSTRGKRLLIGTNREESALFLGPHPGPEATAKDLGNMGVAKFDEVYRRYADLYPTLTPQERLIRAVTAEEYWVPSMRVAEAHVQGGGSAYVYELEFAETSGKMEGYAYHSLDVGLVWDHPHKLAANAEAEAALSRQVHQAWASFIRGESPAADGLPTWPQYDLASGSTMILNTTSRVEQKPQDAELQLWSGLL